MQTRSQSRAAQLAAARTHFTAGGHPTTGNLTIRSQPKAKLRGNPKVKKPTRIVLVRKESQQPQSSSSGCATVPAHSFLDAVLPSIEANPQPRRERVMIPFIWKIYMDGCPARVHSIVDVRRHRKIYHHARDADKPLRMALIQGRVQWIENTATTETIYDIHRLLPADFE
ncbi:hypothetical protein ABKA04_005441 [Annulohypoxylon sp. FPYF3050]